MQVQTQVQEWNVRRTPDGSIDYRHYSQLAGLLHDRAVQRSIIENGNTLLSLIRAATNGAWRAAALVVTAIAWSCRRFVGFWMIAPLGPADRLRHQHEYSANRSHFL